MPMSFTAPIPPPSLLLLGGGGHALTLVESAHSTHRPVIGFYDDNPQAVLATKAKVRHLGNLQAGIAALARLAQAWQAAAPASAPHLQQLGYAALPPQLALPPQQWCLGVGSLTTRADLLDQAMRAGVQVLSPLWATLIHTSACIAASARIEPGVSIGPACIIQAHANIRAHAIINSGTIVEHECDVAPNCHIAPGCILAGNVTVGNVGTNTLDSTHRDGVLMGIGSRVLPGLHIGARATVGAGAVVTRDVSDGAMVVGVPAKPCHQPT